MKKKKKYLLYFALIIHFRCSSCPAIHTSLSTDRFERGNTMYTNAQNKTGSCYQRDINPQNLPDFKCSGVEMDDEVGK